MRLLSCEWPGWQGVIGLQLDDDVDDHDDDILKFRANQSFIVRVKGLVSWRLGKRGDLGYGWGTNPE